MRVIKRTEPAWIEALSTIRVGQETLSPAAVGDFCSILSLADRVLIASLGCGRRPESVLAQVLVDRSIPVTIVSSPPALIIERSDTVVVIAGPDVADDDNALVQSVIDSGAVLLTVTTSTPPAALRQADAAIGVPVATAPHHDLTAASCSRAAFELMALIAVAAVEYGLAEITGCQRWRDHAC